MRTFTVLLSGLLVIGCSTNTSGLHKTFADAGSDTQSVDGAVSPTIVADVGTRPDLKVLSDLTTGPEVKVQGPEPQQGPEPSSRPEPQQGAEPQQGPEPQHVVEPQQQPDAGRDTLGPDLTPAPGPEPQQGAEPQQGPEPGPEPTRDGGVVSPDGGYCIPTNGGPCCIPPTLEKTTMNIILACCPAYTDPANDTRPCMNTTFTKWPNSFTNGCICTQ